MADRRNEVGSQFIDLPTLRNVYDRGEHEVSFRSLQRRESDLDRDFGAVPAQAVQITSDTHWARPWVGEKLFAKPRMSCAKAVGDERLDLASQHFGTRVAKECLDLGIREDDNALPVHH